MSVIFEPPFELNDAWRTWLGSIQTQQLSMTSLAVLSHQPSATVGIIDDENEALKRQCLSFIYALFIAEVFHYDGGLVLSGSNEDGAAKFRQASRLEPLIRPNGVSTVRIDEALIRRSAAIAAGMRSVHTPGQQQQRLHRGFHSWIRGVMEYYGDERLHQFVRAVEAIVKPEIGRTKKQFMDRCKVFVGDLAATLTLLREIYELRSLAEHLHPFDRALTAYPQDQHERIALLRGYQAQLLASHVYERIFSTPDLQRLFATEAAIDAFWGLSRSEQINAWGPPIDLDAIATTRFIG
ncbi:MAG TPA: hypothetical protein VEJ47_03485 [Candidatus Eremiobacteraceae bacterium]|nr:hypothetical protein [Candidatus Eremiobacteraceae bacterium]